MNIHISCTGRRVGAIGKMQQFTETIRCPDEIRGEDAVEDYVIRYLYKRIEHISKLVITVLE